MISSFVFQTQKLQPKVNDLISEIFLLNNRCYSYRIQHLVHYEKILTEKSEKNPFYVLFRIGEDAAAAIK